MYLRAVKVLSGLDPVDLEAELLDGVDEGADVACDKVEEVHGFGHNDWN